MEKTLEDIFAEVEALFADASTLKGIIDDYFNFAYDVKDDHVKKKLSEMYSRELEEWRQLYNTIVQNSTYSLDETRGFSTMSKMVQQIFTKAIKEESDNVNRRAKIYEIKIAKGLDFLKERVEICMKELSKQIDQTSPLFVNYKDKLIKLIQKINGMDNEALMVRKSLDAKLEYSSFLVELTEEFSTKCKQLNFLYYDNKLKHSLDKLSSKIVAIQKTSKQFYRDVLFLVKDNAKIASGVENCLQLTYSQDSTQEIMLEKSKNELGLELEKKFGAVVTKTKMEMIKCSNNFEKDYSNVMTELYTQLNKPILSAQEERSLKDKQAQLEKLHETYIKEFSPLYTFFCVGWSKNLVNILIEKEKASK